MKAYLLIVTAGMIFLLVYPIGKKMAHDQLENIGLVNHVGMAPELVRKWQDKEYSNITVWEFRNKSIPLEVWENKRGAIEAALDISIVQMKYGGNGKARILLYAVSSHTDFPAVLPWHDRLLRKKDAIFVLGQSLLGDVTVDLSRIPHILLGGSTGSGKTVLLKLILMQAVKKSFIVCIADFKGGVDFPKAWHKECRMICEEQDLLDVLSALLDEMQQRKGLFLGTGSSNIDEYNHIANDKLQRYIFACDEVAELLDKSGADKERKELIGQIESKLATIARQGRAFGMHLLLATQRPDANILSGQIRNNMDFRVCGKADSVLSKIILDNTEATHIPKDSRGRFMLHDGTLFQAYLFDESASSFAGGHSDQQ